MTLAAEPNTAVRGPVTVSVETIAWVAVALLFLGLRLPIVWQAPVGGSEWVHLSGAWSAVVGADDARFIPTFFQALSAILLDVSASETVPRFAAFLATATVPVAVYLLRSRMGAVPALVALLLLAVDAPALWLGTAASGYAFDIAIAVWLLVLLVTPGLSWKWWLVAAFAVATAGPLPLLLAAAAGIVALVRRGSLPLIPALAGGGGAIFGVALASLGFGYGWQGITIAPFELFARAFDDDVTTASVAIMALLYSWPLLVGGIVAAGYAAGRWREAAAHGPDAFETLVLVWFLAGLAWFLVAAFSNAEAPLVAVTLPAAILAAPWVVGRIEALLALRSPIAWMGVAVSAFLLALAMIVVVDWARFDRVGGSGEVARVVILGATGVAGLAALAAYRATRDILTLPLGFVAGVVLISGAFHVGFSSNPEPFPSPQSPPQARVLAHAVLELRGESEGQVVVHESLRDQVTWPFRETVTLTVASSVPAGALVAILPAGTQPPEGMSPLDGDWSLEHRVRQPTSGWLRYVRWYTDRNRTTVEAVPVEVYVRGDE